MKVSDSHFLTKYRNKSVKMLMQIHPEWDEKNIEKRVETILIEDLRNPKVHLDNNYTHEEKDASLLATLDWAIENKPIIAGNGTFYKQHAVSKNPNALMLKEFLATRKRVKGEMFQLEDETSRLYKMKDLAQGNWKKLANSYYGGSGMKASAFYNKYAGPATTKSAQSVISTAMTTFEAFLVSSFTFVDINECYHWLNVVLKENVKVDKWVERVDLETAFTRISDRVIDIADEDKEVLHTFMSGLSEDELTRIYWKNNMIEFTERHPKVKELHRDIFRDINNYEYMTSDDDFDKVAPEYLEEVKAAKKPMKTWNGIVDVEYFYDPNKPPKTVTKTLETLNEIYMKYVYVQFLYTDRIYKLKNFDRGVVTVIDTDSNILSLDTWMEYCLDNLLDKEYGRSRWNNIFIAINTMAYIITAVITDTLLFYGLNSNVAEEYRSGFSMKNEFFFSNLILAKVKKRYLSKVLLREGHRLLKPKYDVKGYDFKKASTADSTSDFFMHVVKDLILEPESIDIKAVMMELKGFRNKIKKSLMDGERIYLPMGNAKELDAYAYPDREQSVRGALAWNVLYPNRSVELPVKLSILKTNIYSLNDIPELKEKDPEMYARIESEIFNDSTGIFVKRKKISEEKETEKIEGLSVIGIPIHEKIPEWIIPHIDFSTVINSVLAPFKSVTETFNLPSIEEGRSGRKTTGFTNIIKI